MLKSARLALLTFATLLCGLSAAPRDQLKAGFLSPPDTSRPGVYWYFMDGNLDRGAITADLEAMKAAGIGYALFLEVNVGVPRGRVDMLSPEWQELYTHAVREAERLGIRIIMGSGPGWAGSGGPWVKPEQSMAHLVASSTDVQGPARFEQRPGAGRLERQELAPAAVGAGRGDLLLGHAEAREVLLGHVDPALAPVERDVLPEVHELERRADGIGMGKIGGCRGPV
jgi:hypothetical protein